MRKGRPENLALPLCAGAGDGMAAPLFQPVQPVEGTGIFLYAPGLEERLNVEYMEEAQNPDTDMCRIPLGTAKQLLLDGASVYRLLPGGAEKIAPIAAVRAGLWYEHYREFAVTPEDLGALDRLVRRRQTAHENTPAA